MQFSSRFSVLFHLPVPIVLFDRIQQSGQFTAFFRGELINGRFDLFHATHVQSVSGSESLDKRRSSFATSSVLAGKLAVQRQDVRLKSHTLLSDFREPPSAMTIVPTTGTITRLTILMFLTFKKLKRRFIQRGIVVGRHYVKRGVIRSSLASKLDRGSTKGSAQTIKKGQLRWL